MSARPSRQNGILSFQGFAFIDREFAHRNAKRESAASLQIKVKNPACYADHLIVPDQACGHEENLVAVMNEIFIRDNRGQEIFDMSHLGVHVWTKTNVWICTNMILFPQA